MRVNLEVQTIAIGIVNCFYGNCQFFHNYDFIFHNFGTSLFPQNLNLLNLTQIFIKSSKSILDGFIFG